MADHQAMQRWKVTGADRETGEQKTIGVEAMQKAEAIALANEQKIVVSSCELNKPTPEADAAVDDYNRFTWAEKNVRQFYWIVGFLLCFLGLLGAIGSDSADVGVIMKCSTAAIIGAIFLGIGNLMDIKAAMRSRGSRTPG